MQMKSNRPVGRNRKKDIHLSRLRQMSISNHARAILKASTVVVPPVSYPYSGKVTICPRGFALGYNGQALPNYGKELVSMFGDAEDVGFITRASSSQGV